MNGIRSRLKIVNENGGWLKKQINSIYAPSMAGKSLLMIDEAYWQLSNDVKVVILDTEGGVDVMLEKWDKVMRDKYNVQDKRKKIKVLETRSFEGFMEMLGKDVKRRSSKKGKFTIEYVGEKKAPLRNYLQDGSILVIDSFTSPFRVGFPSSTENLPARADAMGLAIDGLFKIVEEKDVAIVLLHHASLNPTNPYENVGVIRGGNTVMHFSKTLYYLQPQRKKVLKNVRKMYGVRMLNKPSWEEYMWLYYSDNGVSLIKEEDVEKLLLGINPFEKEEESE